MQSKSQLQSPPLQSSLSYTFRPHKIKKKLKLNTSKSRGEHKLLKIIIKDNNWQQVFKEGDLMWSGLSLLSDDEFGIALQMKVNRLPEMGSLCQKKTMGFILNKFSEYWPERFWFYPKTYLLPEETETLVQKIQTGPKTFIAKPSQGSQGDGITLIKKLSDIPTIANTEWIVQSYIDNPLLIQNKKFDLRLYVLISSVQPYFCYLNEEGLARFCAEQYEKPTKQNFGNVYMHLTNYSLNKNHKSYVNGEDAFSRGNKRCLKTVWEDLAKQGIDVSSLKAKIQQLTTNFMIGLYPFVKYYYNSTYPKEKGKNFQVIGIDILVDDNLQPWFLEANNNPSFNIQHEVDCGGLQSSIKKQHSAVDEYVKRIVVQDAIYLATRSLEKQKAMEIGEKYYSFKKILDSENNNMSLISNILKLFHKHCSVRSKAGLTSSQFCKLSKLDGTTSQKLKKNDFHLLFIKIMRFKENSNLMQFEDFIDAIEIITKEVIGWNEQNKLQVMEQHVEHLVSQI